MGKVNTRESVLEEFDGFGNGHSFYMLKGVILSEFLDFAESVEDELIGGVKTDEDVITFDMCEKYHPNYANIIAKAFPKATVYGIGEWDSCDFVCIGPNVNTERFEYLSTEKLPFTMRIDEIFMDEGNIRVDLEVTDKETGAFILVGDLFCFNNAEEVQDFSTNDWIVEMSKYCPELKDAILDIIEEAVAWFKEESCE